PTDQVCASDKVCRGGEDAGTPGDASLGDRSTPADAPADGPRECPTESAIRCEGNAQSARSICQGGKWTPTDPCADGSLCDTTALLKCKPDHSGFELNKTCTPDAPCNAQAGDCTTHACSPMQKRCNGDKLEQCNADQSGFMLLQQCGAGLCDSQALQCDK